MKTYVLKSRPYLSYDSFGDGYYTGNSYMFQNEKYAVCDNDLNKAKHYKSFSIIKRVATNALSNFVNYYFDIAVIENGKEIEVIKVFPN